MEKQKQKIRSSTTLDGWNPANQLRLVVHPFFFLQGFIHPRCCRISEPSTVPWCILEAKLFLLSLEVILLKVSSDVSLFDPQKRCCSRLLYVCFMRFWWFMIYFLNFTMCRVSAGWFQITLEHIGTTNKNGHTVDGSEILHHLGCKESRK